MVGLHGRDISLVRLEDVTSKQREINMEYVEMVKMLAK
jgi:hypothetical protein